MFFSPYEILAFPFISRRYSWIIGWKVWWDSLFLTESKKAVNAQRIN